MVANQNIKVDSTLENLLFLNNEKQNQNNIKTVFHKLSSFMEEKMNQYNNETDPIFQKRWETFKNTFVIYLSDIKTVDFKK
jgi:hypothetical protein